MDRRSWSIWLAALAFVVLAVPASAGAADTTVEMKGFAFDPRQTTVSVGDSVTWTNADDGPSGRHNAVARDDSWRTPILRQGDVATITFDTVGTYEYICSLHPGMIGSVNVVAAPAPPATDTGGPEPATDGKSPFWLALSAGLGTFVVALRRRWTLRA